MRYFSSFFWITLSLFTINQFVERAGIFIPFIHSYFDDILCPGIVMGFALFLQQQLTFRDQHYTFGVGYLIVFVLWYSLLFEVIFPFEDARHHSDLWDVFAYSVGAVLFHKFGNKPARRLLNFNLKRQVSRINEDDNAVQTR